MQQAKSVSLSEKKLGNQTTEDAPDRHRRRIRRIQRENKVREGRIAQEAMRYAPWLIPVSLVLSATAILFAHHVRPG